MKAAIAEAARAQERRRSQIATPRELARERFIHASRRGYLAAASCSMRRSADDAARRDRHYAKKGASPSPSRRNSKMPHDARKRWRRFLSTPAFHRQRLKRGLGFSIFRPAACQQPSLFGLLYVDFQRRRRCRRWIIYRHACRRRRRMPRH